MAKKDWIGTGADRLTFGERLGDLIDSRGITQSQLAEQTGLNQSALSDYINKGKAPTCASIVALARYFSVSTDYLLGITADPAPVQRAVDDLGLSPQVIEWFLELRSKHGAHGIADDIFLNEAFQLLVDNLCDYYNAVLAEFIYHDIFLKHFPKHDDGDATQEKLEAFYADIGKDETRKQFEQAVTDYLYAQRLIWNRDEDSFPLASVMTQGEGFTVSDLAEYKASKRLQSVLEGIGYYARDRYAKTINFDK